jgi:hypothetical protein
VVVRRAAVVLAVVAAVGAMLCFTHQPSIVVDGEREACDGSHLFYDLAGGLGSTDAPWRPLGCEAEYDRWMTYAGALALVSFVAGTGAAFYRREEEPADASHPASGSS